jgi:hypothetical protein
MIDDFPGFVTETSSDRDEMLRALIRWRAAGAGRDILLAEVRLDLEEEFLTLQSTRRARGMT